MSSGSPLTLSSSSTEPGPSRRISAIFMLRRPISTVTSMGTSITKPRLSTGLGLGGGTLASCPVSGSSDFNGLVGSSGRVMNRVLLRGLYSSSVPSSYLHGELPSRNDGHAGKLFHTADAHADRIVGRGRQADHVPYFE